MTSSLKYACLERERRFLLARAPDPAEGDQVLHIEDRYLEGSRLRLRLVRRDGQDPVYKLGQKIRVVPAHPSTVAHTTLYLDRGEYESLRRLGGRTLTKTRTLRTWHGLTLAVDVFAGELEGLVLAEVDLGEAAELPASPLWPSSDEVTQDERFTGGALASTSREQLRRALRERAAGGGRGGTASRLPGPLTTDQARRPPAVPVRLEPVSAANVRDVCALRVAVGQERFVTANAVSLAEAQFHPAAWVRAAYAGQDLVGFVMLHDSDVEPGYMLWRLMIDSRFQGRGYGRQVVHLAQEYLRGRPSAHTLKVVARGGRDGPAAFYMSLGFTATGELVDEDEAIFTRQL